MNPEWQNFNNSIFLPGEKDCLRIEMKASTTNVLIGAVVLAVVVYFFFPAVYGREGFAGEESQGQKIGGYVAIGVFLFVVIGGMIAAFSAGGSK